MNPLKIIKYQMYLLQLENYELGRYWELLIKKGFYSSGQNLRKELVWTLKVRLILFLSSLIILIPGLFLMAFNVFIAVLWFVILLLALPVVFSVSLILIWPFDYFAKKYIENKARKLVSNRNNLQVVGIAGSYGKTTMKNILDQILSTKFNVLATPESINTPVGIARWILKNFKSNTDILVIEMGEHYKGDISYLCSITQPDIAIITGINEAHLERLKSLKNATDTIFEIIGGSKKDSLVLLNADDENVLKSYKSYLDSKKVVFYSQDSSELVAEKIKNKKFDENHLEWSFDLGEITGLKAPILGEYVMGDITAAIYIAKFLGINEAEIKKGVMKIVPVIHRLQPIKSQGDILVIDDSYNGNPDGVLEAIRVLNRFKERRKLFITPGIVETGAKNAEIHKKIGEELAEVADLVLLIRNSATPFIEEGLLSKKFIQKNIIWFDTAEEAHNALGNILKPRDVILFQNDWGDQYL